MQGTPLNEQLRFRAEEVQEYLKAWFASLQDERGNAMGRLFESMAYSALGPGKRFRPVLSLLVAETFHVPAMKVLPWAASIEMVHTYSLIHDDLPCMDDDDERRGRPTNHKAFDEATALLAGDALLTEAFGLIGEGYSGQGTLAGRLVATLAQAAGCRGMIGGQSLDMAAEKASTLTLPELERIHELKTGRLIQAAIEGAAIIAAASPTSQAALAQYGARLGLAFQIADDVLDGESEGQDGRSYVFHLGREGTRQELERVSEEARAALEKVPGAHPLLLELIRWNQNRKA